MVDPVFLPLMRDDQPDTAERVRLAVQMIPFGLPKKNAAGRVFAASKTPRLLPHATREAVYEDEALLPFRAPPQRVQSTTEGWVFPCP